MITMIKDFKATLATGEIRVDLDKYVAIRTEAGAPLAVRREVAQRIHQLWNLFVGWEDWEVDAFGEKHKLGQPR